MVASFHLQAANTFFKNHRAHLATWQHATTKRWYVKDYILVSGSAMRGVSDCCVFCNVHHGPSDHCLLGVSLQLHLRVLKRDAPTRQGLWEGAALRDPGRYVAFGQVLGNRFAMLSPQVSECRNPNLAKCGGEAQHLEKLGIWSPPGLPNVQSSTAGPKTPRIGVFLVSLERS
jgi:hypothetical protein